MRNHSVSRNSICFSSDAMFPAYRSSHTYSRIISNIAAHFYEKSTASDIVYTAAVSGVSANFLRPSLEAMGITEELWGKSKKIDFGSELDAAKAEAKAWKTIWSAGQGVTSIDDVLTVNELVSRMKTEFISAIEEQQEYLAKYR